MCTICGSDVHSYRGRRPNPLPGLLGHEIIGVVEEIGGDGMRDLRGKALAPGDRVTWTEYFGVAPSWERDVLDMPQKSPGLRKYGHERADIEPYFTGGLADYCYLLPGTGIVSVPPDFADEEATPLNCGAATMVAVTEAASIDVGTTVAVQGLGLLGLYGVALARTRGERLVIGIDAVVARRDMALRFVADLALDPSEESADRAREAARWVGVDVVIEVCGVASAIRDGLAMLRVGGRYVVAGLVTPDSEVTLDAEVIVRRWITIRGVHNYHPRHLVQAVDFVAGARSRFPFRDRVQARFALTDVAAAFDRAAERSVIRAAVVPTG
jgi:alcohol dehydrogenase